ncbi:MAG: hypothetical protein MI867_24610, partial [Pseudomonadales bacterium]|nr:hypothetical protein [Pseudomonadales bacterium]
INKKLLKAATLLTLTAPGLMATSASFATTIQVINYSDGSQYKGQLSDGERNGEGSMSWANGDQYQGQWKNDLPHGYGKKTYVDSSVYEGDFVKGNQHGKGLFTYPDGTTYKGDWRNDSPNGLGTFSFKEAGTYDGAVMLGLPHGQGSFTYNNGDFYDGQWDHGKRHGMGKLRYNNGNLFVGSFEDGVASGSGAITYNNGLRYKGTFKKGKPHGDGTCFKPKEQALCSYENGIQVAYAVIPSYLNEEQTDLVVNSEPPKAPVAEAIAAAETTSVAPAKIIATQDEDSSDKSSFVAALETEKKQLEPNYSSDDLAQERSDILFNHNFETLKLSQALRTGTWKKQTSLFNDYLVLETRSGDLKLNLKIKLFDGPGTYHVKSSDIKAWFNGKPLEGLKEFANIVTIKEINDQWVAGNVNLSFSQKDNYGDYYKVENGVFRLNNAPIYSPAP